jgi:hypothetical protein
MAVVAAVAGAVVSGVGAAVGANQAKQAGKRAGRAKKSAQAELDALKEGRQKIINPYESTTDLSSLAADLSGDMSNPFTTLGVATQAAEIQMEQTDIALANTLDTLRASGASAGGATALAQAALASKKGVAASIESQEANNDKLRAQGEQNLQSRKTAEKQRQQSIAISEGQRVQAADAAGKQFEFQAEENRTNADMDRAAAKISQASAQQAQANQARSNAIAGGISAVGSMATSLVSAEGMAQAGANGKGTIF